MFNREGQCGSRESTLVGCIGLPCSYGQGEGQNRTRQTHLEILRHYRRIKSTMPLPMPKPSVASVGDPIFAPILESSG
jgi:hypothetical protein